jgi:hypothetical protein
MILACLIREYGLDWADTPRDQLARLGSASTATFDDPCEILIKPLQRRRNTEGSNVVIQRTSASPFNLDRPAIADEREPCSAQREMCRLGDSVVWPTVLATAGGTFRSRLKRHHP